MARPTPVLPLVGSMMVPPARSWPPASARSTIARPIRSFTDPPGFRYSTLARIVGSRPRPSRDNRTIGVLPTASRIESYTRISILDQETPASAADRRLPVPTDVAAYVVKGDHAAAMALPEKWDPEFAHLLGWLVGDGSFSGNVISAIYGSAEDREAILPRHQGLFSKLNGGREPKVSVQENGTVQLRLSRRALASFFEALGLKRVKAAEKDVPWSILQAPTDIVGAFLRGLFDADGTVVNGATTRYVGLASRSKSLLKSVQTLLATLGIGSQIYQTARGGVVEFTYMTKAGQWRSYESTLGYDLRIGGDGIDRFSGLVGFNVPSKVERLRELAGVAKRPQRRVVKLVS